MNPFVKRLLSTPTTLQTLLFSKYGNIEEDLNAYYINQIVYNKKTHYESVFKESQYNDYIDEFLRRFYTYKEGAPRIPKLSNYYKNYHLFFCRPIFRDWKVNLIMSKYGDCKAEEFYNNNYGKDTNEDDYDMNQDESDDESSSDNDNMELFFSNNKGKGKDNKAIIFDKKTKMYIDEQTKTRIKNLSFDNEKNTITLTLTQHTQSNNNGCLSSKRSLNGSFYMLVKGLLTKQNKKSSKKNTLPNSTNNNMNHHNINSNTKKQSTKSSKLNSCCKDSTTTKSSLCSLTKNKNTRNTNIYQNLTNKILFSPELHNLFSRNVKSSLSEFSSNQPNKNNMKCTNDTNNNNNNTNNNCIAIKNGMNEVPHHRKNKTYYCGNSCNGSNQGSLGNDNMSKDNKKLKKAISATKRKNNHKSYNKLVSPISLKNPKMKKQIGNNNGTLNLVKSPRNISSTFSCFNLFMNMKTTNPNNHYRYINSNNTYHSNVKLSQTKASSSLNKNYNTSNNNNNNNNHLHHHKQNTLVQSQRSTNNTSSNNNKTSRSKIQTRNSKLQNYQINSIKTMNPSSNNQIVSSLSNQSNNKTANLLFTTSKSFENSSNNNNNNNIINNGGNFNSNSNINQTLHKQKMQHLFKLLNTRKWPFDSNGRLSHYVPDKLAAKLEEIIKKTNYKNGNMNGVGSKMCNKFNRGRSYTNLKNENEKNKNNNNANINNNYKNKNHIHCTSNNIFGKTVEVIVTKRGKSGNKIPSSGKRRFSKNKY